VAELGALTTEQPSFAKSARSHILQQLLGKSSTRDPINMTEHGNVYECNSPVGTLAFEMAERKDPKKEVSATEEPLSPIGNGEDMERQKTASDFGHISSIVRFSRALVPTSRY